MDVIAVYIFFPIVAFRRDEFDDVCGEIEVIIITLFGTFSILILVN
jgi:hypothetical protein